MKITKVDNKQSRMILTGMIVDKRVLSKLAPKWEKDGLFGSLWENLVAGWCIRYFKKYGKAPSSSIENLFASWAQDNKDKETTKAVELFLSSLSSDYARLKKSINSDYIVDTAASYFTAIKIDRLREALEGDRDLGKLDSAVAKINGFRKIEVGLGSHVDVLQDESAMMTAMENKPESLVKYEGALGKFFGRSLARDNFVAYMGPMKRGKTFWCIDLGWRAMLQRKKVAYFQVGDLTQDQMMLRFGARASRRPIHKGTISIPKSLVIRDDMPVIENSITKDFKDDLSWQEAVQACKGIMKDKVRSDVSYFRLSTHPNSSLTVDGLRAIIEQWAYDDWVPDVVIIDYADILAPPVGFNGESRDAVNHNWKALRRLNQELHCLMVTATQANAASFSANTLEMAHFAEDNRKYAHVTAMIGLNQNDDEKENEVTRLNFLVLREDRFSVKSTVYTAGCLAITNPAIVSAYPDVPTKKRKGRKNVE